MCLLRSAAGESVQPKTDTALIRSLFIDAIGYLLEALPANLTPEETRTIRNRLPEEIRSTLPPFSKCDENCTLPCQDPNCSSRFPPSQPSLLHRTLASTIVQLFLVVHFLIPYLKIFLRNLYQYERTHHVSERVLASSIDAVDALGKGSLNIGGAVLKVGDGKLGTAIQGAATWWVEGVTGGIYEGVGEGMIIMGARRPDAGMKAYASGI